MDKLPNDFFDNVTRLELIDHRACKDCNGAGHNNDQICDTCRGMGSNGREVIFYSSQVTLESSIQDEGKTFKLFLSDKENNG